MDAYSTYNQTKIDPTDEDKATFYTHDSVYCYKIMPFGLKNASTMYQQLVNHVFKHQLGKNTEAHVENLQETFDSLQWYNIKLNPTKCIFGVDSSKF